MKFEINLILLIKPFCCMTKKPRQKFKYLEKEKSFRGEIKSIFHKYLEREKSFRGEIKSIFHHF